MSKTIFRKKYENYCQFVVCWIVQESGIIRYTSLFPLFFKGDIFRFSEVAKNYFDSIAAPENVPAPLKLNHANQTLG